MLNPEQNQELGRAIRWFYLVALESPGNPLLSDIELSYSERAYFPGKTGFQLEYFGLITQRGDKYALTDKGIKLLEELIESNQIIRSTLEIPAAYLRRE